VNAAYPLGSSTFSSTKITDDEVAARDANTDRTHSLCFYGSSLKRVSSLLGRVVGATLNTHFMS
jgi:hypothetical protein